jgi:hypothetical protein
VTGWFRFLAHCAKTRSSGATAPSLTVIFSFPTSNRDWARFEK